MLLGSQDFKKQIRTIVFSLKIKKLILRLKSKTTLKI